MSFPSGVKAHIFVSWLHPFKEQKLVVVGDKKMAVFDDVSADKLVLYPHRVEWVHRAPVAHKGEGEVVPVEKAEPLRTECAHFLECIAKGRTPKTDGEEGLRVLRVLAASQRSLDAPPGPLAGAAAGLLAGAAAGPLASAATGVAAGAPPGAVAKAPPGKATPPQDYFVHESSMVDAGAAIGSGTKIWHFSHVMGGSVIGKNCNIGQNVVIGPDASIGNGCKIQNNVSVYKGVTLEDDVFCGPSMVFTNVHNPRAHVRRMDEVRPTLVGKGASLGANSTIVCGHTIGRYAFIGAAAVVTRDVPDYALVVGNPARFRGWMCACGNALSFESNRAECGACGARYEQRDEQTIIMAGKE